MKGQNGSIIIVDGYSTGALYAPLIHQRNIPLIHVQSTPTDLDAMITQIARHTLDRDKTYYTDMIDGSIPFEELCLKLKDYAPMAILPGCELGVELADKLAFHFSLPGNDPESSLSRRDKFFMHQALSQAGLRFLKGGRCSTLQQLLDWVQVNGGLPVVVKPPKSAGTEGVHICRSEEELVEAFQQCIHHRTFMGDRIDEVLVQEYASGQEIVINTVSCGGQHWVSDIWTYKKIHTADGRPIYDGIELVSDLGAHTESVLEYAFSVLDALKITQGAAHSEIMLTPTGPVLIECGARTMGGCYSQKLMKESIGWTQLEMSLEAYLDPVNFPQKYPKPYHPDKHAMIKYLISTRTGAMEAIPGISLLSGLPSVRGGDFLSCLEKGSVERTVDLFSAPAHLFLCHEDAHILHQDYHLIRDLEEEAQTMLFEMESEEEATDPEWFGYLPDEHWLKPEELGEPDAEVIGKALDLFEGMEILDCPCGDARVSIHLAKHGARITGVDLNPRFIQKAKERFASEGLQGEFHVDDMRDLKYANRFDAIVNWFNSFGYFDVETDFYVLKLLQRSLKPGGLLLVEAPNRSNIIANTAKKFQKNGAEVQKLWDEKSERLFAPIEVMIDGKPHLVKIQVRMYSMAQYRLFFRLAGLEVISVFGEGLTPFNDDSKRLIFMAKKR